MSRKVVVGTSGGVNSSVAAWLSKEQGYDVIGVTMQIWQDEDAEVQKVEGGCCGLSAVGDARKITMDLGIPYYVMNLKEEFRKNVTDHLAGEYMEGRTPSPCIACSRHVKQKSLFRRSMAIGADHIATGHYAQIDSLPGGHHFPKTSVTAAKNQICALYNPIQEQLPHTPMSVGSYHKEKIWNMAERLGLLVAHKPDSQEICFIPDHDYALFIEEYMDRELPPRSFVNLDGNILGRYRGTTHYTVGQRKGLNLSMGRPAFVVEIRPETNEIVVGDNRDAFINALRCDKLNWTVINGLHGRPMDVLAKIRYSHKGSPCIIREIGYDMVECRFHEPVRAVTPGRTMVFYDGDHAAGGGTIIG